MTEGEYWQVNDLEVDDGDVRLHGLDDDGGWEGDEECFAKCWIKAMVGMIRTLGR